MFRDYIQPQVLFVGTEEQNKRQEADEEARLDRVYHFLYEAAEFGDWIAREMLYKWVEDRGKSRNGKSNLDSVVEKERI